MTTITAEDYRLKDGRTMYAIRAEGHAIGGSKVCAGISAIIYALAGYVRNHTGVEVDTLELLKGYADISFCGGEAALAAYQMAAIGLAQIAYTHPDKAEFTQK